MTNDRGSGGDLISSTNASAPTPPGGRTQSTPLMEYHNTTTHLARTHTIGMTDGTTNVTCYVVPCNGPIHMAIVQPMHAHRDLKDQRCFNLFSHTYTKENKTLSICAFISKTSVGLTPNLKLDGCVYGDAYIEAFMGCTEIFDHDGPEFQKAENISVPPWALEETLSNLFLLLHADFSPQCKLFSRLMKEELDLLSESNKMISRDRFKHLVYSIMIQQDHPHIECYHRRPSSSDTDGDDCLIVRSREGAMHCMGKMLGFLNKELAHCNRILLMEMEFYNELISMKDMTAPSLRSDDIGRKLAHLYRAIQEKFERDAARNASSAQAHEHREMLREEAETQVARAEDNDRCTRIKEARAASKRDKPLTTQGKSHRPPSSRGATRVVRGWDKAGKIEQARQHEQNLKDAEEARQKEVRKRIALVRVGELIAGCNS
jgi:hypothetical protein